MRYVLWYINARVLDTEDAASMRTGHVNFYNMPVYFCSIPSSHRLRSSRIALTCLRAHEDDSWYNIRGTHAQRRGMLFNAFHCKAAYM